jgi:RHS repeat-associated protein
MGRVVTQKQVTGSTTYSLSYAYNLGGLLTSQSYPSGRTLTRSYDEGGRLSSLSDGTTTFASSFSYAPHGGLTSETWGSGAVHTLAFNRRLQTSQMKLTLSGTVQQQYDYSYGQFNTSAGAVDMSKNNGQIGKIDSTIGTTPQWNQGFSYDELGRLTNVREHQGSSLSTQTYSQSYAYDRYGNRTQSVNSLLSLPAVSTTDYDTTNNNNRFVSSVATYDAAGNITTDAKFRSLTYAYDANGRQKSATNGTWTQTQVYDCAGQRVQTTVGSTTRTMVYDVFGQNVAEYLGSTLEREHIYRAGMLLAIYEAGAGAIRYVLTDAQGSTRAVLNSNGTVMARHDYLPFGEEINVGIGLRSSGQGFGATDPNRQKYGLTERDDTTGLDHTWWRKYENKAGRWTSPDPLRGTIGAPQTFNAYTYAANDPVNFVDPTGLDPQDPPPTTHVDPATGRGESVPGIDAGVVTVTAGFEGGTIGGSALGMFGSDANQPLAVINFQDLKRVNSFQTQEHPHGTSGKLPFNSCAEFVDFLVKEAVAAFYDQPFNRDSKAKQLGVHLMDLAFNGYDRHINNKADGFKDELTVPGGQGAGVYGHILGQGGAKLGGLLSNAVGGLADAYDTAQWLWGNEQAPAEMAGNLAGWAVGRHIYNFLTGKTPSEPERLRNSLTSELCK